MASGWAPQTDTGTSSNRKASSIFMEVKAGEGETSRACKFERFKVFKAIQKEHRAAASQQRRLEKHPVASTVTNAGFVPPPIVTFSEPMEVDRLDPVTSAVTSGAPESIRAEKEVKNDVNAFLASSTPSSLDEPLLVDDNSFFKETPPSSPGGKWPL